MEIQQLLKSRLVTILLVVVFSITAFLTFRLYIQKREVDSEVARLQQQSDNLNNSNEELSELIKYLETPEYKEKEAREKLNLKKEGEQVVVLPDSSEFDGNGDIASANTSSNPNKWFDYFFSIK